MCDLRQQCVTLRSCFLVSKESMEVHCSKEIMAHNNLGHQTWSFLPSAPARGQAPRKQLTRKGPAPAFKPATHLQLGGYFFSPPGWSDYPYPRPVINGLSSLFIDCSVSGRLYAKVHLPIVASHLETLLLY